MPKDLTDANLFDTVRVPEDGDLAAATTDGAGGLATLEEVFQVLANRTRHLLAQPNGLLLWGGEIYAPGDGGIYVLAIVALLINGKVLSAATSSFFPSGLSVSTWYYVYAYDNAGAIGFEYSTTAPLAGLVFKGGPDTTRRYLGCFYVDANGDIVPFRATRGRYVFRRSAFTSDQYVDAIVASTTSHNFATYAVEYMPPHARVGIFQVHFNMVGHTATGDAEAALIRTDGDTGGFAFQMPTRDPGQLDETFQHTVVEIETNADQEISARAGVNDPGGTPAGVGKLSVYALGFTEASA
jgi:hypothetical protein